MTILLVNAVVSMGRRNTKLEVVAADYERTITFSAAVQLQDPKFFFMPNSSPKTLMEFSRHFESPMSPQYIAQVFFDVKKRVG